MGYTENRIFGDSFMPEVKSILGRFLLHGDFTEEDMCRNTDLMVLKMEAVRIGVRIRRYSAYEVEDWRRQFTIRYKLASGEKTEYQKILDGWGDYFFYGFEDESGEHLKQWFIGDFNAFRDYISKLTFAKSGMVFKENNRIIQNHDFGDSTLIWFWKAEVPDFVVADSAQWEKVTA